MPQAGIHGVVSLAVQKWAPDREWLILGVVLGNLLPDADNLVVAVATLTGTSTEGLHRTFTHSLFTIFAIVVAFYLIGKVTKRPRWGNLGLGLGIGILMHLLLDLLMWFNGVEILWPIPLWVNFWTPVILPDWWRKLMLPAEFLAFALFFVMLSRMARKRDTNGDYLPRLRVWTIVQGVLFVAFTILVYSVEKGFMIPYGALYLLSLGLTFGIIIRMRATLEAVVQ